MSETVERPQAQNGFVYLGTWDDGVAEVVNQRWPYARLQPLGEAMVRVDLSASERGLCPGFNDAEGLADVSKFHPGSVAMGFFCDGVKQVEGVRVFVDGKQLNRQRLEWAQAPEPDPILWPIGKMALSVQLPIEAVTQVARPERPPLSRAMEALLNGGPVAEPKLLQQALEVLGRLEGEPITDAIVAQLSADDWVIRYHAVKSYTRLPRGHGVEGRPRLEGLLEDPDEGVREAVLEGIAELIPKVEFSDRALHEQIDAAIAAGLADADEDVQAAAGKARGLRQELLG